MLLEAGHTDAAFYPIGRLWAEANMVRRRKANVWVTFAVIGQAIGGAIMGGRKGGAHLKKVIKGITDG